MCKGLNQFDAVLNELSKRFLGAGERSVRTRLMIDAASGHREVRNEELGR